MEGDRRVSVEDCVASFARGTPILLVHDERLSLGHLSSLLRQCSFRVTVTTQASGAIDMISREEGKYKLVVAKANMPDMSTLSFLNKLIRKDMPVLFISSGQNDGVAKAAVDKGLCYLLEEPIKQEDLIHVWQKVNHPDHNLAKRIRNAKSKEKLSSAKESQHIKINDVTSKEQEASEDQNITDHDVKGKKRKRKRDKQMNIERNPHTAEEETNETREHNDDESAQKKQRMIWTPELHHKFVEAISVLGDKQSRPKEIRLIMNVPNLTCRHIASHLQKFKSHVRRLQAMCNNGLTSASESSSLSSRTKSSSSFESQSYLESAGFKSAEFAPVLATSAAFQNENQDQDQLPMNFTETQGPESFQLKESPSYANFSFQHPTELSNYGNEDLEAVVRGAAPNALMDKSKYLAENNNISKFLGKDCDKFDCFGNGSSPDDTAQNAGILKSSIHGNSFSSKQSNNCNPGCVSLLTAKPATEMGGPELGALLIQSQTLAEDYNLLSILGEDCERYDSFEKGLDDNTQDSEILKNSIYGDSSSSQQPDNCNTIHASLLQAQPSATVGGPESGTLTDRSQTLTDYNSILRFIREDWERYDGFGKGPYEIEQNSEIPRSSILGNSFPPQQFDNCQPSNVGLLKAKPYTVMGQTMPDALMDHCQTLEKHNNILRILGEDFDQLYCFRNEPSPNDIAQLKNSTSGDNSNPPQSGNCNTSCV